MPTELIMLPYRVLTVEEVAPILEAEHGNVTQTSAILNVDAIRLRAFVNTTPALSAIIQEAREQLADTAEGVLREALTDEKDAGRRDSASKFVLSNVGRSRGYGSQAGTLKVQTTGPVLISWADGSELANEDDEPPNRRPN